VTEKRLKMMRYLRKNYYSFYHGTSKNLDSLCSEFISAANGRRVPFLNWRNTCYLQITNLIQVKYDSKGNLIRSNSPSGNNSHLAPISFMIYFSCSYHPPPFFFFFWVTMWPRLASNSLLPPPPECCITGMY
jgi:hypothetical protein